MRPGWRWELPAPSYEYCVCGNCGRFARLNATCRCGEVPTDNPFTKRADIKLSKGNIKCFVSGVVHPGT